MDENRRLEHEHKWTRWQSGNSYTGYRWCMECGEPDPDSNKTFVPVASKESADRLLGDVELGVRKLDSELRAAQQQLVAYWKMYGACPCGARAISSPHVSDCPTEAAIIEWGKHHDAVLNLLGIAD